MNEEKETYIQHWKEQTKEQSRLQCYLKLNREYGLADYLVSVKNITHRHLLTKYRLSDHQLAIEKGRHKKTWLPKEERICNECRSGAVETEEHFLLHCAGGTVISERRGTVMVIGINRPEARNAVNQETAQRLTEELSAFDQDNSLDVAVLYGVGGNFCAGFDLKELAQTSGSLIMEQDVCHGPGPMGPSRMRLSKPLIAAVSGYAVAGGLELALLADLRVVEESSIMGVFCRRFAAQMSGVNDNYYVYYYIQHHNTSIAQSEIFLSSLHPCSGIETMEVGLLQLI
ncbi:Mevalonyl-coenzyme A hydratase sidH [Labeo rohita]|uniref:Mevalonyl-coenzyme A hydratase sidH n=1 Tax=Labeo rohita TaxID=84645 RepID=A0ABQ8LG64_LABRO|nr:Mevalonyl-coenzyme A hydratase sidH [Labeo rohita]